MPDSYPEVRDAVDELGRAFEEFKSANDRRITEIARKGVADPITAAKVDRLGAQIDRVETCLNRTGRGSPADFGPANWRSDGGPGEAFAAYLRKGEMIEPAERKALTLADNSQAGYLAPVEYVTEIIKGEIEFSPLRSVARVRQTSARAVDIPRRSGVFAAQWVAEVGTKAETTGSSYALESVPVHEMFAQVDVSNQMLEDSAFNLEAEVAAEFSEQFGIAEGSAFINGTAVGMPEGVLSNLSVQSVNSGSATGVEDAAGQFNGGIDLMYDLAPAYARNGTWILNRRTLAAIRKMKDQNDLYVWQMGMAAAAPPTILGAPYLIAVDMPDEGAGNFPILFGDFRRGYLIIDRINMSILRDPYSLASTGKVKLLARRRVGAQVVDSTAIRKLKCSV